MAEDAESETMLTLIQRLRAGLEIRRPISFALQVAWSKALEVQRRTSRDRQIGPSRSGGPARPGAHGGAEGLARLGACGAEAARPRPHPPPVRGGPELSRARERPRGADRHDRPPAPRSAARAQGRASRGRAATRCRNRALVVLLPLLRTFDGLGTPRPGLSCPVREARGARDLPFTSAQKIVLAFGRVLRHRDGRVDPSRVGARPPRSPDRARRRPAAAAAASRGRARAKSAPATAVPVLPAIAGASWTNRARRWRGDRSLAAVDRNAARVRTDFASRQDVGRVAAGDDGGFRFGPLPSRCCSNSSQRRPVSPPRCGTTSAPAPPTWSCA